MVVRAEWSGLTGVYVGDVSLGEKEVEEVVWRYKRCGGGEIF